MKNGMTFKERFREFRYYVKNTLRQQKFLFFVTKYSYRLILFIWKSPNSVINYVKGQFLFHKLANEKEADEIYLLIDGAVGDALYALAYLDALHNKYPGKKIVVFGDEKNSAFLKTYEEIDDLRLYKKANYAYLLIHSNNLEKSLAKNIIVPLPTYYKYVRTSNDGGVLFYLRNYIYNIPDNSHIKYHSMNKIPVTSIENFYALKDKIVIVNPYSKEDYLYDQKMYELFCDELISRGYIVFTNVINNQKPLRGTQALNCSLEEIYSIACDIPLIVSRRSGLLDLLLPSGINMFVVYADILWFYDFHKLSEWHAENVIEEILIKKYEDTALLPEKFSRFLDELKAEGRIS